MVSVLNSSLFGSEKNTETSGGISFDFFLSRFLLKAPGKPEGSKETLYLKAKIGD